MRSSLSSVTSLWREKNYTTHRCLNNKQGQTLSTGCGIIKQSPKKTGISRKRPGIFCCISHQLMATICKIHKLYYDIPPQTKLWLCEVQSAILPADQFNYKKSMLFNCCKETWHVDASNIHSDSKFEVSNNCFLHTWSLLQNDSIAVLI